ncbi:MAG: type I restriction endonuclease subunit R [Verrucomicrobia bacterium]|nr:type I restriction endonuclease subunit R [Verrucomicrobiota bacterium]
MAHYSILSENAESTVVAEYEKQVRESAAYQSEADLEKAFIGILSRQAYDYLPLKTETELIANLRERLEELNGIKFSDSEWNYFFKTEIANENQGIVEKTHTIQEDSVKILTREDGSTKNIRLLDTKNIHNNALQVVNQYVPEGGVRENRYDVTILVNGLPLVHIELKRRGVDIKEAFNQIRRYRRESFWSGSGLFEYVQIFVISNGTLTKYYANTTRERHIRESAAGTRRSGGKRTSNSFEFTSWWADAKNAPIEDLEDFARTFFAKHTLLNILTKYCIFTSEKNLLVMRPYQIVAVERIIGKIRISSNYRQAGTTDAGGYIWHTTGSGKTLTSFKTAQLASRMPEVDKVLFVVDRKDLDYQTMVEYDRFEKGAANGNTSTAILTRQLEDESARIIITTIQKLAIFIKKNRRHPVFDKRVVIIFDECHRSQFGDMHMAITKHFKKYHLFGFTGTPIFALNAGTSARHANLATTQQAFGEKLHTYTIVDAITDGNVLPFRVDYVRTMRERDDIADKKVRDIDRERAMNAPARISKITEYILEHFNQKTKRNAGAYEFSRLVNVAETAQARDRSKVGAVKESLRLSGFNSIFATASVESAKLYYAEFKRQMAAQPEKRLKIALIYSFGLNEDEAEGLLDEENPEDMGGLDAASRDFLENAIKDYNREFGVNYDTSSEKFQNYYKDVSLRMKNRELDLLIVVNMFLTGFDATTLNTLWVDKNLRMHGLLQAYSRTNRILNSVKTFGNIVCFRNLEKETNDALALFGNRDARGVVLLRKYKDYYSGYKDEHGKDVPGYEELIETLKTAFPLGEEIVGEEKEKEFIRLYGAILKLKNILSAFDVFAGNEILSLREFQDYQSVYLRFYDKFRRTQGGNCENINDDIVFEMELVKQVDINIDYILMLITTYNEGGQKDKEIVVKIRSAVGSSPELRNKKDLIDAFIESLTPERNVETDWKNFIEKKKEEELAALIAAERLNAEETKKFIREAFQDGFVRRTGTELTKVLPPVSRFSKNQDRSQLRNRVLMKLEAFFERFKNLIAFEDA